MDGFIDDIITINIDDPCWVEHVKNVALLVIHTIFRLLHPHEPLKLDDPLSLHKIREEYQLYGRKTCLCWNIHTRSLRVFMAG